MIDVSSFARELSRHGQQNPEGFEFEVQPIPGEVEILQILVEDREELPIFITFTEDEILCTCYLFHENEVRVDAADEMHLAMVTMNVPMPLSSFGRIEDQYVVFGALSAGSDMDAVVHEIEVLSENALEAINAMRDYLK